MADSNREDAGLLDDVAFPSTREDCVAAVHATRDYIHDHGGATKTEIGQALVPEENYPCGHNGVAARAKGLEPGFRDWWWDKIALPGLRALPDVEPTEDGESSWQPISRNES